MRESPGAGAALKGIILAAGRGARLGNLTAARPKCLTRLHGRRLIDWQLAALRGAGVAEIAVVRGYRAADVAVDATFFENPRWAATNSVASLCAADAWLRSGPCVVSYSDIVYSTATVAALLQSDADLAVSYDPAWLALWRARFADPLSDAETFRVAPDGTVLEIGGRAASVEQIEGQYMGLLACTPRGWAQVATWLDTCPAAMRDALDVTALLRALLAAGTRIAAVRCVGPWYEVDSASDLALYERMTPVAG